MQGQICGVAKIMYVYYRKRLFIFSLLEYLISEGQKHVVHSRLGIFKLFLILFYIIMNSHVTLTHSLL